MLPRASDMGPAPALSRCAAAAHVVTVPRMTLLPDALRAGATTTSTRGPDAAHTVLVAGGGGALGSAVLECLLGRRCFAQVRVLAARGLPVAMRGLDPIFVESFADAASAGAAPVAQTALIVFDRARHANGRELAFARPVPEELPALARWAWCRGVRQLVVILPHAPAQLPAALKAGLANLDEHSVAALGFDHVVFVRSAQAPVGVPAAKGLQRVADGVLAQLRVMVAASNQPVRAQRIARFAVELAAQLPGSAPGTRVAPPELVWQAAQMRDPAPLVQAWLEGRELPRLDAPRMRM